MPKHTFKQDVLPAYEQMHSMLSFVRGELEETELDAGKMKRLLQFLKALVDTTDSFDKALAGFVATSLKSADRFGLGDSPECRDLEAFLQKRKQSKSTS